ncbi:MAG: hypothetical protein GY853_04105 [PVC group bacterium]|nr:hypothetical protein [PVC group bacterium]
MKHKEMIKCIKEARNLPELLGHLVGCFTDSDEDKCEQLKKAINCKIDEFKKTDDSFREASRRSMHSERLAAMGQMAAAISHDLRNPLSGIKVAAEYLMRKLKDESETMDIINNIHNEVIFANSIISNILEHARISEPSFQKISIKKSIDEAVLTVAQQGCFNKIKIKKRIDANLPLLNLDSLQMRQVFMNLFNNSAEAMVGGGELKIDVLRKEDSVVISISDSGGGIEKDNFDKLFEPFFTTKVKGIGLGLAITKEIVEKHKGQISAGSKTGKGATFTISLPIPPKNEKKKTDN